MFPHPVTGEPTNGIAKVRYSHEAMIELLIADPMLKQNDLAAMFDRSPAWVSQIISSDAFQARLAERRKEIVDPTLVATVEERLRAVANVALSKVLDKLSSPLPITDDFLLKSAKLGTDALGYGARQPSSQTTNVAVVLQVPAKAASTQEWVAQVSGA